MGNRRTVRKGAFVTAIATKGPLHLPDVPSMPPKEVGIQVDGQSLVDVGHDPVIVSRLGARGKVRRRLGWQVHEALQGICVRDPLIAGEVLEQLSNPHVVLVTDS